VRPRERPPAALEDNVLNYNTNWFNHVPRLAPIGGAAGEECARRAEEFQQ
jgi:hypothetical protein